MPATSPLRKPYPYQTNEICSLVLKGLQRAGYTLKARAPTNLGWLGPYDGNIIGGLLIGIGMTLTGSCPGTVFAQLGSGIPSAPLVLSGGTIGGIIYTALSPHLKTKAAKEANPSTLHTIPQKTGLDTALVLLLFEGLCAGIFLLASSLSPRTEETRMNPLLGGLLIGLSQLTSVLLTKSTLGISSSYEEAGKHFWKIVNSSNDLVSSNSMLFALGATLGSFALSRVLPDSVHLGDEVVLSPLRMVTGGAVMAFGSRLGMGCTSGHGISGMALLGVSSFVSVVSMFGGGMAMAAVLR